MGEIINTGLGWLANEDWLMEDAGIIGSLYGDISDVTLPDLGANPIYNTLETDGLVLIDRGATGKQCYSIYGSLPVYALWVTYGREYLIVSKENFTLYYLQTWGSSVYTMNPSNIIVDDVRVYYSIVTNPYGIPSEISDIPVYATRNEALAAFATAGDLINFYKLDTGYAITCFIRWLNANQDEVVAPILISTDLSAIPISLDGETETQGVVTGIEFGGMTFYINILLGYSGTVSADVPYHDLTTIYPQGMNVTELFRAIATLAQIRFTDPYAEGGHSQPGGGEGTFDLESDVIGVPSLPTTSFAATGFSRIYNPTLSELNSLANYLWTDTTFLDTVINHLKQLLENPMDAIISLALLPCSIPNGSPEAVKVMYINTGVTMAPATSQFVDVDCGTYTLQEFYGSALDYNPYTKVHCYLPYIGQVTLDTDEVMGKTIHVRYRIDIVTGMCAALISVNQSAGLDETVMYQFSGHCSINMPTNSADFSGYIGAAMTAGKMVAGVVAGASGNLPLAGELIGAPAPKVTSTSETTETIKTRNPKTGRQVTNWSDTKQRQTTATGASFGEMSRKAAANTVGAVMGGKLTVEHAGGFTGNSGYLAVRRPYLIIERPRMCNPEEYGKYNGRPSMIYMNLGECEGYTEVQSIQFENISATNPELAELSELLKSGVLF